VHARSIERTGAIWLTVFVALCALILSSRKEAMRFHPPAIETQLDIPPFPSEIMIPFSFGFRSVVADVMFLEAIQVMGSRPANQTLLQGAAADRQLARLLDYSTELDPRFAGAYRFAGYAMPRSTLDGRVANAVPTEQILERGVRERPEDWRISFLLGYVQAFYLGEFQRAAENLARAARIPGSPKYLGFLATRIAVEGGELDSAEQMAKTMVDEATEEQARSEWQARLVDLEMERRIRQIESAVRRFRARTGRAPASVEDLVRGGDLPKVPEEPHGQAFVIENGEVRSTAGPRPRLHHPDALRP